MLDVMLLDIVCKGNNSFRQFGKIGNCSGYDSLCTLLVSVYDLMFKAEEI